ncbi:MAG: hypothetical protein M9939_00710 [Mesorhizobium sp.]|nr:hypothetical protein [Mesorhizobium sp.]MCO5159628.1 hypothetical protein [Mesorhizobium sp.]
MTDKATETARETVAEKTAETATQAVVETKATETATDTSKATGDADKGEETADTDDFAWPDDWRERLAKDDPGTKKLLDRHTSLSSLVKKLVEQDKLISSGKIKRDMPDASDEKAMAEWRKEQGIPDDPSGYKLPDTVTKALTDEDKPVLATFTEFAHKKGLPNSAVEVATEWYVSTMDQLAEQRAEADNEAREAAEDALRKDWAHGEFKANMTLASRAIESIPGVGKTWSEFRAPDGRRLGDIPEFIAWAADMGRDQFGDVTFANGDSERKHTARREEIEKIRDTDFDRYEAEGLDKEYRKILEKDLARGKR